MIIKFYCPNCQTEHNLEPQRRLTTPHGQVYLKAACPICHQDLSELLVSPNHTDPVINPSPKA